MDRRIVRSRKARRRAARKWGVRRTIVSSEQQQALDRFRDSVKLKGKSRPEKAGTIILINNIVIAILASILLVFMFILQASLAPQLSYCLMIAITDLLSLHLLVCLFLTVITPMDLTVEMSIFVHNVYVFCLTNSVMYFVNLSAGKLVKLNHRKESTAVLNELAPFVCFTFMDLAEIAALFFCFYDVIHGRVGRSWDSWWIQTAVYPILGVILLIVFWILLEDSGEAGIHSSNICSIFVSLPVSGYILQIFNQRLAPKEDVFKQKQIHLLSIR